VRRQLGLLPELLLADLKMRLELAQRWQSLKILL
jgi:hypothetical protein